MSQGALDRTTFETIEAYVLDRMSASERAAFEERMAADAGLRKEVALQQEHIRAVELGGLQRILHGLRAEEQQANKGGSGAWWRYAAAAAILIVGSVLWFSRPSPNERLFAEHFTPDPGLPVAMGATEDPAFADAMVSYKEGKYAEARAKWSPLQQLEPSNDTLRYFIASAWLSEGRITEALPLLQDVSAQESSAFRDRARWYLFLAHIHTGATAEALAMPLDDDPVYGERVRRIKQRLEP